LPTARQNITTAVILSIGRILAETAPLYLTSGLASSNSISLINPGQTLTTRIYAQIYTGNVNDGKNIMYECAIVTMLLVLLIILTVHVVLPAYYSYKQSRIESQNMLSYEEYEKDSEMECFKKENEKEILENEKTDVSEKLEEIKPPPKI
jgi:phosphate transport system permease protein